LVSKTLNPTCLWIMTNVTREDYGIGRVASTKEGWRPGVRRRIGRFSFPDGGLGGFFAAEQVPGLLVWPVFRSFQMGRKNDAAALRNHVEGEDVPDVFRDDVGCDEINFRFRIEGGYR
jgi:hypothetical protein